jgi:hypothetical protein
MDNEKKININEEVLAVISAAIASLSIKPAQSLVVKPMRRVSQSSSVWNNLGRIKSIGNNRNS